MLVLSPKTCPLLWDRPISFLWWWWSGGGGAVVAANRWLHPGAGSARTDEPLPVPREDPNPTLPLSHVNFPSASHLLPALVPGPALGLVSVAAL